MIPGNSVFRLFSASILLGLASVFPAVIVRGGEEASPASQLTVGERLSFHGRWLGIPVGHGWIEVQEMAEVGGRQAYHLHAEGHSNDVLSKFYPIHDTIESYVDAQTLQPLRFEKHQREGRYKADEIVTFDYAAGMARYQSLLNGSTKQIPITPDIQDLLSALYWFRTQPLSPNQPTSIKLYTDEKIYETQIQVQAPASLELLKRGTFRCFVVEPKASFKGLLVKRGRIWAYLTADQHRLPLEAKATTPWGQMSAILDESSIPEHLESRVSGSP